MKNGRRFLADETGTATTELIVLTAVVIGMCLLVTIPAYTSSSGAANTLAASVLDSVKTNEDD
ncbi:hypothetical protein C5F48_19355 [Cereibacter changlensis JA139]|uniref:Uncharacterized protein n=1 Tax=Cereibacter changlensis JA139 TaxID=1188249 RepID=A0A2T4JQP6_9RHOB|nr:hypothetical protein C5F48_19355 [Cereibacter changlensis JA139]